MQIRDLKSITEENNGFTTGRLALLIAFLLTILYPEVVFGSRSFFYRDSGFFGHPLAHHLRDSFWRGEFPLWNPLNNCGLPFLAQWNTMVFYPFSLLPILLPLPWALNIFCLMHLVLAGVSMKLLAERWVKNSFAASVAGLSYALNGLTLHSLMWPNNIAALAWMPLAVLVVEKAWHEGGRHIVVAALIAAVQMVAGAPEIILFTWLMLATLWLAQAWRKKIPIARSILRFLTVVTLVACLTAIQMLPFLDLLQHSHRDSSFSTGVWAMPAWGWANLVVPIFRCSPAILGPWSQNEQQWTSSYYLGIGILSLALLAAWKGRRCRVGWLVAIALAGLILALGENGIVFSWIRRALPPLGFVRYPIKFIVLAVFAVPLLAAFGIDSFQRAPTEISRRLHRPLFFIGIFMFLAVLAVLAAAHWFPRSTDSWNATWKSGVSRAIFLIVILFAVGFFVRTQSIRARALVGWMTLLVLGLDALTHTPRQNPTVKTETFGPLDLNMTFKPRPGESRAMLSPQTQFFLGNAATPDADDYYLATRGALYADCNLLEGVPKVNGFFSLYLREEAEVRARLYNPTNFPSPLADFLGVSQISSDEKLFQWNPRSTFLPLVTAGQKPVFADATVTLNALASPEFNPRREVYLPMEALGSVAATNPATAEIRSTKFAAHEIAMEVDAKQAALVVIAQTFYHCWHVEVDGKPEKLWRANHAFQAFEVPGGKHSVKLVYRDRMFCAGAIISCATLLSCLFFHWRARQKTSF